MRKIQGAGNREDVRFYCARIFAHNGGQFVKHPKMEKGYAILGDGFSLCFLKNYDGKGIWVTLGVP